MKAKRHQEEILESDIIREFVSDVMTGLGRQTKFLSSKYLYDKTGSQLFEEISELPEYYPTRVEAAILQANSSRVAKKILNSGNGSGSQKGVSVIELGSGSSTKTRILLEQLVSTGKKIAYFPIDISGDILQESTKKLRSLLPSITVTGIPMDYNSGIDEVTRIINENTKTIPDRKLVLFLGSSIGNFEPEQSISFLRMLRSKMEPNKEDMLLVGFDLRKDPKILHAAYNDRQGVTAKFNLNLLARINRELDCDFDLDRFSHLAFYNRKLRRIEMHLVSKTDQAAHIRSIGTSFSFTKGESIHTENSYKYSLDQIRNMARESGFKVQRNFMDSKKWFSLTLMSPVTLR